MAQVRDTDLVANAARAAADAIESSISSKEYGEGLKNHVLVVQNARIAALQVQMLGMLVDAIRGKSFL